MFYGNWNRISMQQALHTESTYVHNVRFSDNALDFSYSIPSFLSALPQFVVLGCHRIILLHFEMPLISLKVFGNPSDYNVCLSYLKHLVITYCTIGFFHMTFLALNLLSIRKANTV